MQAYEALAAHYDAFCLDVPYDGILDFYRALARGAKPIVNRSSCSILPAARGR